LLARGSGLEFGNELLDRLQIGAGYGQEQLLDLALLGRGQGHLPLVGLHRFRLRRPRLGDGVKGVIQVVQQRIDEIAEALHLVKRVVDDGRRRAGRRRRSGRHRFFLGQFTDEIFQQRGILGVKLESRRRFAWRQFLLRGVVPLQVQGQILDFFDEDFHLAIAGGQSFLVQQFAELMQIVSRFADPHQSGTELLGCQEELSALERQGVVIRAVVRIGLDPCRVQLHQAEHVIGVDDKVF